MARKAFVATGLPSAGRTFGAILGAGIALTAATAAPAEELRGLDDPTLALGLSGIADYNPGMQFLDIMRMGRRWLGHKPRTFGGMDPEELESGGFLDADGWLKSMPEGIEKVATAWQWDGHPEAPARRTGTFVIRYRGEGDLRLEGSVSKLPSGPGELRFEALGGTVQLAIYSTDPAGTGDYLRDITVVREEHLPLYEAGGVYNPDWLALVADARQVRFMDWMATNNSSVSSWSERPTRSSAPRPDVAMEDMVQLANEIGADPWFTMPHKADDDYIRNFATYVRDNLDPDRVVRVEYSNETWNFAFWQTHWFAEKALEDWGVPTGGAAYVDYHVKKATETARIWEEVFAGDAADRLINVIGSQTVNTYLTERLMDAPLWREHEPDRYVDPASVFEEIAVTSYFGGHPVGDAEEREKLIDAIQDPAVDAATYLHDILVDPAVYSSIPETETYLRAQAETAHRFGLRLTAYEGGQHVHHSFAVSDLDESEVEVLTDFMIDFTRSPEMADLYRRSWASWQALGDGPYMQFGDMTRPSKWGSWGIYESLDATTLRGEAVMELNAAVAPWWGDTGGDRYRQGVTTSGTAYDDRLTGTSRRDYLLGGAGDDVLIGGAGDDGINGGDGSDRVVLAGAASDYDIAVEGDGYRLTGPGGSDFVVNVEVVEFDAGDTRELD